tara:strand:- start:873 stop:1124 length:252 start_codon:yes stop_codon:yes gene_type:complete
MTHSYTNPSEKQDLSHLEATAGGEVDHQGWPKKPPISDRECIFKCLDNCVNLAGLDKKQVERLMKEFAVEKTDEQIKSEFPPL